MLGALRGDRRDVVRTVLGFALVAVGTVAACLAVLSMAGASPSVAQVVIVLGGSAVTLGFGLTPLIAGADDLLDPRRFAVFGRATPSLASSIAVAGFVSVPTFAVTAVAVCAAIVWIERGTPVWAAVVGAVLSVVVAVLLARVGMGLTSLALRERRSRELSGLFLLAVVVVLVPAAVFVASLEWRGQVPSQLLSAVTVLGYTPIGAAWAIPGAVGGAANAIGTILVALVTAAGLWALWVWIVGRLTTTAERPVTVRERGGLGWFAVAPGVPFGAIAARSLVYWLRDRRYLANAIVIPIAAAIATVPPLIAGVPENIVALIPVPIMALLFGWLPHNDVAYDSTAVWMHVASGTDGLSDRIGRLVPVLLMAVPLLAVLIPVSIVLYDRWALLPALVGVAAALFLSGLGLSSVSSVVAPYPVSQPGDSPFQQPQRSGSSGVVAQALVLLGAIAAAAPALWWSWLAISRDIRYAGYAMWGGLAMGLAVFAVGVAIGAALFRRRGSRLMEFAEAA